jgi:hypothetical protein
VSATIGFTPRGHERMIRRSAADTSAILALMEMPPATRSSARDAMDQLHKDGSPVVRPETANDVIEAGWRRWQSFKRRNRKTAGSWEERLEDLAKGLRDAFEPDRRLVGPLMEDYRHLASTLGQVFMANADASGDRP